MLKRYLEGRDLPSLFSTSTRSVLGTLLTFSTKIYERLAPCCAQANKSVSERTSKTFMNPSFIF